MPEFDLAHLTQARYEPAMTVSSPRWPVRRLLFTILAACLLLLPGLVRPAMGQAPSGAPAAAAPEADPEELRDLLSTLEDPAARERLTSQIRALLATGEVGEAREPGAIGARTLQFLSERVAVLSRQMVEIAAAFRDLPLAIDWAKRQIVDERRHERWVELGIQLAGVIFAGFLAAAGVRRLLSGVRASLERRAPPSILGKLPLLFVRMLIDLVPVAAFALAAYGLLSITDPPNVIRLAALVVVNAHILIGLVLVVTRALLSPNSPGLRLLPIDGETAHYGYIWVRRIAFTAIYGYLISQTSLLLGLPSGAYMALLKLVGLIVTMLLIVLVLQNRMSFAEWLRGNPLSGGRNGHAEMEDIAEGRRSAALRTARRRIADIWHIFAIAYLVVAYAILALNIGGGFEFILKATLLSVVIVAAARGAVSLLERVVRHGFAISPELHAQYPRLEERANRYLPVAERALRGLIWFLALLALLSAWGLDSFGWLETPFGERLVASGLTIAFVLVAAVIAWEFVSNMIERYLVGEVRDGTKVERSARVRTLLPLLRNAFLILLITIVSLITLSELGLDIAPLLAGAGVIGLAVGFGSQTLVKDVITGLFILFEDTISVGDVVDVGGGHSGVVEAISVRTIRLRDMTGTVHSVPFSQVASVKNLTKDFSFYVFNISVGYGEDTDRVIAVLRELGAELQRDPAFARLILEPIEILGVDSLGDNGVVIVARFKTRPIQQWNVGREFNRRLKKRFSELGIEIPFPQRTIHVRAEPGVAISPEQIAGPAGKPEPDRGDASSFQPRPASG
jgi:moderate conductance mechanosensitive channel